MSLTLNYRNLIRFSLVLLWVYAASSKLLTYDDFENEMSQQPLPQLLQLLLTYTLPGTELFAAALLAISSTSRIGLYFSAVLLLSFTIYIALGLMKAFSHIPCACGGILRGMGWWPHLLLNIFFLALTILIIRLPDRKEVLASKA